MEKLYTVSKNKMELTVAQMKNSRMQNSKEYQGEIRKPSSGINAKKEGNNRMGKTRDIFKKIRDTKGIFYAKMGSIKDRNGRDLTEAENIKKRW